MTRRLASALLALVLAGMSLTGCQSSVAYANGDNRMTGAWRLASLEEPGADGAVHPVDASGMFVASEDGHLAIQVMYANAESPQNGPVQYAQGGYEASFGTYEFDDQAATFTYHVQGALVRTLIGQTQTRVVEFTDNAMTVRSPDPNEHWRVRWQRDQ